MISIPALNDNLIKLSTTSNIVTSTTPTVPNSIVVFSNDTGDISNPTNNAIQQPFNVIEFISSSNTINNTSLIPSNSAPNNILQLNSSDELSFGNSDSLALESQLITATTPTTQNSLVVFSSGGDISKIVMVIILILLLLLLVNNLLML